VDRRTERTAQEIGENLASWRKLLNLTSQQVSERAGISRSTLSRLENGDSVGFGAFLAVTRALGIVSQVATSTDPWETDLGRMRSESELPKRVRHRG